MRLFWWTILVWTSVHVYARRVPRRWHASAGQSMVEYAIVAALIAVAAMAAVQALGGGITNVFNNILHHIQGVAS